MLYSTMQTLNDTRFICHSIMIIISLMGMFQARGVTRTRAGRKCYTCSTVPSATLLPVTVNKQFSSEKSVAAQIYDSIGTVQLGRGVSRSQSYSDELRTVSIPQYSVRNTSCDPLVNRTCDPNADIDGAEDESVTNGTETYLVCSSGRALCHGYIQRMIRFYKNIGGWLLLGIVCVGMILFAISYLHGVLLSRRYTRRYSRKHRWAFSKEQAFKINGRIRFLVSNRENQQSTSEWL